VWRLYPRGSSSALTWVRKLRRAICYTCPVTATDPAGNAAIDAGTEQSGKVMLRLSPQIICTSVHVCARHSSHQWVMLEKGSSILRILIYVHTAVRPRYHIARTHFFFHKMTIFSQTTRCHNTEDRNINIISPFVECIFVVDFELSSAVS
jgi:hypothetical protein